MITERQNQPTTLQALEIVNGDTLTNLLHRGALRLRDQLPPAPPNLFDSGSVNAQKVKVDVDIAGAEKLWLVLIDVDSYDPLRTRAGWGDARFDNGSLPLATEPVKFKGDTEPTAAVIAKVPSTLEVDVPAGATRFQATVGVDETSLASDINPRIRYFVFPPAAGHEAVDAGGRGSAGAAAGTDYRQHTADYATVPACAETGAVDGRAAVRWTWSGQRTGWKAPVVISSISGV